MLSKTTNRRAVMAGIAAAPALSVPALASSMQPDPIFAAMERHRSSWEYFGECLDKKAAIEQRIWDLAAEAADKRMAARIEFEAAHPEFKFAQTQDELRSWFYREEREKLKNIAEQKEADELESKGGDATYEAAWAVAHTMPTTLAGVVALLAFMREREEMDDEISKFKPIGDEDGPLLGEVVMASVEEFLRTQLS